MMSPSVCIDVVVVYVPSHNYLSFHLKLDSFSVIIAKSCSLRPTVMHRRQHAGETMMQLHHRGWRSAARPRRGPPREDIEVYSVGTEGRADEAIDSELRLA